MTDQNKAIIDRMFRPHGNERDTADINARNCFTRPDTIQDPLRLEREIVEAKIMIRDCEDIIAQAKAYIEAIEDRKQYLATAEKSRLASLERYIQCGSVRFDFSVYDIYPDGTRMRVLSHIYEGKDRHAAIRAFKDYCKDHPAVKQVMKIEKGKWER